MYLSSFWQHIHSKYYATYRKIKMTQILVFRLTRKIKVPRNAKNCPKNREIKMPQKFHEAKISCFKVFIYLFLMKNKSEMPKLVMPNAKCNQIWC